MICKNLSVNEKGHLTLAGQDTTELAAKYGTPLYLMDEDRIRENLRNYNALAKEFLPEGSHVSYAGKACCFKQMYRILKEEGNGADLVSPGEILTAKAAGFDMGRSYFHGNNKTNADIIFAMENGVGTIVADNEEDLQNIEEVAAEQGKTVRVVMRLTPGIDPHTYDAVATGKVDSKFGVAIETGQAEAAIRMALGFAHIRLAGFHCHVGSQVFGEDIYVRASEVMLRFMGHIRDEYGFVAEELNMGGGIGVRYTESDPVPDVAGRLREIGETVVRVCNEMAYPVPQVVLEPGRSIVADAGMTLYTAGTVKRITGYKTYVSIDGGMTDNPRYALYKSRYTCLSAGKMNENADMECTLAGRCCESGDLIQENIMLPSTTRRGDLIAVLTTGAYNYSMASNYNRVPRPAVVMLKGGENYVAVRRETIEDLIALDV